jgi:hypothetical protein
MKSKAFVLKNGTVQHYSMMFDLYFVTVRQNYSYKSVPCNRLIYFILGKGKHRKNEHRLQKVSKPLFDKKLKETKQYEEWARLKKERQEKDKISSQNINHEINDGPADDILDN